MVLDLVDYFFAMSLRNGFNDLDDVRLLSVYQSSVATTMVCTFQSQCNHLE